MLEHVRQELARAEAVLGRAGTLPLEELLEVGVCLESTVLEAHSPAFLKTDSEELKSTIRMLIDDTEHHRQRLQEALSEVRGKGR